MPRLSDDEVRAIVASYHRLLMPSRAEQEAESLAEDLIEARAREVEMREALESIWGHWYANNVSTERSMEAIRELFAETEAR